MILGPTASGKSDVAMAFARRHRDVEIVVVDAMQVYRGMDIGTAKPTAEHRQEVQHHCVDLVAASSEFSLADHRIAARCALVDIESRGRRAVVVAGTGLYLRAVIDEVEPPGRWPEIAARLEARVTAESPAVLYRELIELDPVAAARIEPGNARRVVRALEVCLGSGRPFSSFGPGLTVYPDTPARLVGLRWPRDVLRDRIARRVHQMIDEGLVGEVAALAASGLSRTARQALGYREVLDHLDGRISLDEAIIATITRTVQFAVRQERWFRRDPRISWIDITHDPVAEVLPVIEAT